jgi:DNA-binding transcriptional MerR regulator
MFFHKKQEGRPIPTDEINAMTKQGMSDKDIIKRLKGQGYSYNEIEKAMLSAVKSGVSEEKPMKKMQPRTPAPPPPQGGQDFTYDFGDEAPNDAYDNMAPEDIFGGQQQQPQFQDLPQFSQEPQQPVEELVEGLIEEKWQRFQEEINRFDESIERINADMKVFEERIEASKGENLSSEVDARITELSDHLEEVDARVGGLERAFKQMLPSLTRNIESLSSLVNDMKSKQEPRSFA